MPTLFSASTRLSIGRSGGRALSIHNDATTAIWPFYEKD